MKKTVLLAVVPLILAIIGCSKDSNSSGSGANCTFEQVFSGGKVFRPSFWVHYRNSINIDQKYYSSTDSNITTFQFNGNGLGSARVKYVTYEYNPTSMLWGYIKNDTTVAMTYVINSTEKRLSLSYYEPKARFVYTWQAAIDSFTCKTFRTREVTTSGTKIDEYYTTFVND